MSEIVTRIADSVGISPEKAETALGMMLGFLQREAADGPVARMIEAMENAGVVTAMNTNGSREVIAPGQMRD